MILSIAIWIIWGMLIVLVGGECESEDGEMTIRTRVEIMVAAILLALGAIAGVRDRGKPHLEFTERSNGDYQLVVNGGRQLVCEERQVVISQQPDAVTDLVVECKH